MRMNSGGAALLLLALSGPAQAEAPSVIGGKLLPTGESGHHFGLGIPSFFYEWWNGGAQMDWALHVGLVYADWSGAFTDVDAGLDLEVPMRFHLGRSGPVDVALRFAPGVLIGTSEVVVGRRNTRDNRMVLGLRPEIGVLVGIELSDMVNFVTGGVVPFTLVLVDTEQDTISNIVVPLMPRAGVEVQPLDALVAWALLEMGPTIRFGDNDTDVDPGIRFWIGVTWYP